MAEETIGPYRILAPVGDSGQALSYRAVHTRLDRQVFLKVLPSGGPGWAERRSRFEREAKALAKIDHPAVVRVYDCGEDEGRLYLASEYVEGHDLARRLAEGPLPWEELLPLALTLLEGLEALHTAGIIHRDIKPSNIMLSVKGPKLADLGLARLVHSPAATQSDTLVGTPAYMDPETLRGGTADARSDLFSLGATLFEALAGRRAFPGETFQEAVRGLLESDPIASLPADAPEEARRFLAALLEKRPEQRPQDVASARELLRPSASASRQLPRRHRAAVWLPAVFVMAGVIALTVVFSRARLRPTREDTVSPVIVGSTRSSTVAESTDAASPPTLLKPADTTPDGRPNVEEPSPSPASLAPPSAGGADSGAATARIVAPPPPATLWVATTPWAEVRIDGVVRDTTPLSASIALGPGRHEVELHHPPYPSVTALVSMLPGTQESLIVSLADSLGFLQVLTDPWATIHIDGTIAGTTPLSGPIAVRPGSHVVRAANPFFAEKVTEVAVSRGETTQVEIALREGAER